MKVDVAPVGKRRLDRDLQLVRRFDDVSRLRDLTQLARLVGIDRAELGNALRLVLLAQPMAACHRDQQQDWPPQRTGGKVKEASLQSSAFHLAYLRLVESRLVPVIAL